MSDDILVHVKVPFPSAKEAEIAYNVLRVDQEPKKNSVRKVLTLEGCSLHIQMSSPEARSVRVSTGSVLEHLLLVMETMEQFA